MAEITQQDLIAKAVNILEQTQENTYRAEAIPALASGLDSIIAILANPDFMQPQT